jgi:uncharacterized protein YecT (DUF1311 family)
LVGTPFSYITIGHYEYFPLQLICLRWSARIVVCIGFALAQTNDLCETLSNTIEMNACAKQQFDVQDSLLNRAYSRLIAELPATNSQGVSGDSPRKLLVTAQRKWLAFRDADCSAQEKVYQNGSARTVMFLDCLRERTEQRIKELEPAKWQGG